MPVMGARGWKRTVEKFYTGGKTQQLMLRQLESAAEPDRDSFETLSGFSGQGRVPFFIYLKLYFRLSTFCISFCKGLPILSRTIVRAVVKIDIDMLNQEVACCCLSIVQFAKLPVLPWTFCAFSTGRSWLSTAPVENLKRKNFRCCIQGS